MLEIEVEIFDTHAVIRPSGEIDAYTVAQFRERIGTLSDQPKLLINLSDVLFIDSAGLGALIGSIRRVRDSDGTVVVACGKETLTRLLHTTGFDRIVTVAETLEDAEQELLKPEDPENL